VAIWPAITVDPLWAAICAAWTAVLMLHAAAAKFADLSQFERHLAAYRVPGALLPALARVLPAAEALAVALMVSPWRGAGAVLAATLLAVYAAAMAWQRLQRRVLDCGCGGAPLPVSWALVARNVVLALVALGATPAVAARPLGVADALVVVAAVLLGTLLYAAFGQVLRQSAAGEAAAAPR
jgi:uncharacterized protein (DUF697 family)